MCSQCQQPFVTGQGFGFINYQNSRRENLPFFPPQVSAM
jgi:hypothetical protein